jgi:hypothetical protein
MIWARLALTVGQLSWAERPIGSITLCSERPDWPMVSGAMTVAPGEIE